MAERYDVAIIGAGADGLAAASLLARTGLRVVVLERHAEPGGRLVTRQFHPGYYASPFAAAPIPDSLFWSLDLAKHGALLAPPLSAAALWPDRIVTGGATTAHLLADAGCRRAAALAHAGTREPPPTWNPFVRRVRAAWPAKAGRTPRSPTSPQARREDEAAAPRRHCARRPRRRSARRRQRPQPARARGRRRSGAAALGGLGKALAAAAQAAGAELACGLEVSEIRCHKARVATLILADGSEIAARAVISTLDLKRTFLLAVSLERVAQIARPPSAGNFRIAGRKRTPVGGARCAAAGEERAARSAAPPAPRHAGPARHGGGARRLARRRPRRTPAADAALRSLGRSRSGAGRCRGDDGHHRLCAAYAIRRRLDAREARPAHRPHARRH